MVAPVMKAVEYNSWLSIMKTIIDKIPTMANNFGLSGISVDVLPAYPKDLTKFKKPSIIVQKIYSSRSRFCMGNFVGQYYDETEVAYYDMHGKMFNLEYQININSSDNTEMALLTELVLDIISDDIVMKDYASDMANPVEIGELTVNDNAITYGNSNDNKDYTSFIVQDFDVIQTKIGEYPTVDLTKPISFNQTITL